jgi:hypothetical protein
MSIEWNGEDRERVCSCVVYWYSFSIPRRYGEDVETCYLGDTGGIGVSLLQECSTAELLGSAVALGVLLVHGVSFE